MKRLIALLLVPLLIDAVTAQSIQHAWKIVDRGGGRSVSGGVVLQSSVGQEAVQSLEHPGTGVDLTSGYIPGFAMLGGSSMTIGINLLAGWNMISLPIVVEDYRATTHFYSAVSGAFLYDGGYRKTDNLCNNMGFWMKFDIPQRIYVAGSGCAATTIQVRKGWNMIAAGAYALPASMIKGTPPVDIISDFFVLNDRYDPVTMLEPGRGYWVKVDDAGSLVIEPEGISPLGMIAGQASKSGIGLPGMVVSSARSERAGRLRLTDSRGLIGDLIAVTGDEQTESDWNELPPAPPSSVFDVRFLTNRQVEAFPPAGRREGIPVRIQGAVFPVSMRWDAGTDGGACVLEYFSSDGEKLEKLFAGGEEMVFHANAEVELLRMNLRGGAGPKLPTTFALDQNYPNPFNPATRIAYQLPVDSRVTIRIFNTLGQEVTTLLDEVMSAGFKSAEWNASGVATGVYFYRMDAVSTADPGRACSRVRKMLIVK
jgi:hypothetical protein